MSTVELTAQDEHLDDLKESEDYGSYDVQNAGIRTIPSDYNVKTLVDTIKEGIILIPGFQRNYVWTKKQASKLIESIILGLPVPQIFFYEKSDSNLLVIDGQQRLLSIYYYVNKRFPKDNIRTITNTHRDVKNLPLNDNDYFTDFKLQLPGLTSEKGNPLHGLTYSDLSSDIKARFDRRPIRTITVNQTKDDKSAMYEVFNRLNSGVTLTSQEIRRSMFDSKFYEMVYELNTNPDWRKLYGNNIPDSHMRDVETLLRGFAMLERGSEYKASMVKFLNSYSDDARRYDQERIDQLKRLAISFFENNRDMQITTADSKKFSPIIFECVFVAACASAYLEDSTNAQTIKPSSLKKLKENPKFKETTQQQTTGTTTVKNRLSISHRILCG